jgi:NADH dehydrogenase FAD-containing subunit
MLTCITGAVGIEFAAEIKVEFPAKRVILIHSRSSLLSGESLPEEFKLEALRLLRENGVEVILGNRVIGDKETEDDVENRPQRELLLSDGLSIKASKVLYATKKHLPRTSFLPKDCLDEDGFVKVLPS